MAGMEEVICKMVDALSDVRDAMNKMQSEAGTVPCAAIVSLYKV
jgi:hypothetical protein